MLTPDDALYALKPLLLTLLLPPTPGLVLIAIGSIRLRKKQRGILWIVFGALYCWMACTERMGHGVERLLGLPPALSIEQLEQLAHSPQTAVLVLGGGSLAEVPEYQGEADLGALSLARLRYGIWLARRLDLPLGFTGGISPFGDARRQPEAVLAARIAQQEYGLRLTWAESRSRTTRENVVQTLPLLRSNGIKRIVLVTHAMHLPRAMRAFRQAGAADIELVPAGIEYRAENSWTLSDWLPSSQGFLRCRYATIEALGLLTGR
ncbi:YdcF family protein [Pelomonas sp. SE-A7]|uniref:YdcF family protein n=1 Tax=Pelomonas sp. SE-A7 TaxID=3054953 RepID=UPI00259D134F|nr:YdcF family protein [Pelomonas sp. SE-A7]MDM4765115.1 YdcF family protein [Pelomonas sp. SE-A7]